MKAPLSNLIKTLKARDKRIQALYRTIRYAKQSHDYTAVRTARIELYELEKAITPPDQPSFTY